MLVLMMLYDCVAHYFAEPMAFCPALVGEGFLARLPTRSWSHGLRVRCGVKTRPCEGGILAMSWAGRHLLVKAAHVAFLRPDLVSMRPAASLAHYRNLSNRSRAQESTVECSFSSALQFARLSGPCATTVRTCVAAASQGHCHTDPETYSGFHPFHCVTRRTLRSAPLQAR
jgi:hypothetical protein